METTKFNCMEMALMAATTAFIAAAHTGRYAVLGGSAEVGQFSLDVHLAEDETFTLPSGYVYSEVEEKTYSNPITNCPPFKDKRYYFYF